MKSHRIPDSTSVTYTDLDRREGRAVGAVKRDIWKRENLTGKVFRGEAVESDYHVPSDIRK
jgi:hypothetical protein